MLTANGKLKEKKPCQSILTNREDGSRTRIHVAFLAPQQAGLRRKLLVTELERLDAPTSSELESEGPGRVMQALKHLLFMF